MNDPSPDSQTVSAPPQQAATQSDALAAAVAAATAAASAANAAASAAASAAAAANTIISVVNGGTMPPPAAPNPAASAPPPLAAPAGYNAGANGNTNGNTNGNAGSAQSRANIHNYNPSAQSYQYAPPQQPAPGSGSPYPYQNTPDGMAALPPPVGYVSGGEAGHGDPYGATGQWKAQHIARGRFHAAPWDEGAEIGAHGPVPLRMEWTPPPFFHLYAALEQSFVRLSGYAKGSLFVGVTSSILGEGKTTVALHLALSAARATQKRVCLIDMSLGEDDLCRRMGVAPAPGGVVSLLEENGILGVMEVSAPDNLTFIPAGKVSANPAQLARSKRMGEFFTTLRGEYDLIIADMPAVVTDNAVPLAALMDGVVLVMQAGATPRAMANEAIEKLGRDRVAGVVLNRIASSSMGQTLPTTRRDMAGAGAATRNGRN